ncbi:hypothetical protein CF319_g6793 [Tilletia indica]|nr:hypothetical protein CF319_g6793 [Tilletia indica]
MSTCLRSLTIPHALRPGFDAPDIVEDGPEDEARKAWIHSTVPSTLTQIRQLLDDGGVGSDSSFSPEKGLEEKSAVVACVARFWCPSLRCLDGEEEGEGEPQSVLRSDEDVEARAGLDIWTTTENIALAGTVLDHPFLSGKDEKGSSISLSIALHLLQHYIRPLFSAATTTNSHLDPETGRARRQDPLLTSVPATSGVPEAESARWKGGNGPHDPNFELLGYPLEFDEDGGDGVALDVLRRRNTALGCWNVLGWCLCQLGRQSPSSSKSTTAWEENWHLVLPPLLTLLEDSDPHFRLLGTRLLLTAVLDPSEGTGVPPSLLIRTNVVPLLMDALETSFTFITSGRGHVLLDAALGSARKLVLLTTAPLAIVDRRSNLSNSGEPEKKVGDKLQSWIEQDGGKMRAEELSALLTEGIFKIWSFPIRSSGPTFSGIKPSQRHELIRVTFRWLSLIVLDTNKKKAGGETLQFSSARFLGVVCEFVSSWVEREWAGAWALYAPSPHSPGEKGGQIPDDLGLDEERQDAAASLLRSAEAVFAGAIAIVRASASATGGEYVAGRGEAFKVSLDLPPGIATWAGRVLLATARMWTLLHDGGLMSEKERKGPIAKEAGTLRARIKEIWAMYEEIEPGLVEQHRTSLRKLDADVFKDLCQ